MSLNTRLSLGCAAPTRADHPYAEFFNTEMAPLPEPVQQALLCGPVAAELLPPVEQAALLQLPGAALLETGYARAADGSARIAVLTEMPGVTPAMWDWWFCWHGSQAQRYQLWHPRAHVHVAWADGRSDLPYYQQRVSNVIEYVGSERVEASVCFLPPAALGFDQAQLTRLGELVICARLRMRIAALSFDTGYLVHQLRPVPGGTQMRSRFWLGGSNARPSALRGALGTALGRAASRLKGISQEQITALMVHDAQEMTHLAAILPALHARFGGSRT